MSVKIRLARGGSKKRPYYSIVAADARAPRDGKFLEKIGTYNPMLPKEHQSRITLKEDRIKYWLGVGAQPTDRVARMLGDAGLAEKPAQPNNPKKAAPGQKALDRVETRKEKEEARKQAEIDAKAAEADAPTEETPAEDTEESAA